MTTYSDDIMEIEVGKSDIFAPDALSLLEMLREGGSQARFVVFAAQ
jgi:hypothetical protein